MERILGTNPIAFPGLEELPIVIDLATCAVACGKFEIALRASTISRSGPKTA